MKRIVLFLLTNLAVMLVLGIAASLLGVNRWMGPQGLQMGTLLAWCAVFGMGGSFISLLLSKPMAKWTTGARVITGHEGQYERWLVQTVEQLAQAAGIRTPEVAYYEGAPNAFATGAFRNSALVAVSSGLVNSMEPDEVRAVLAHEVAHIANGDMQTMGLLQGVMNTFVLLAARVVGSFVDRALSRDENDGPGVGYTMTVVVLDLLFGILASLIVMAFSRHREYRADWGAAELLGSAVPMQRALLRLSGAESDLPKQVAAFGISGGSAIAELFRSHPRIDDRIEALKQFGR